MWNINDPPVHFFNLVEELSQLSITVNLQKSEQQVVGIGLDIVRRTGDFEKGLIGWLARPVVEHTWPNFKQRFNAAYRELKRIRGPAMRSTAFHHAHQVVTDLSRDFTQMRDEVMAVMNSVTMMQDGTAINDDTDSNPPAIDTPTPSMNATIDQDILLAIKKLLKEELRSNKGDRNDYGNDRRSNNHPPRRNVSKYCWSHGACPHASRDCRNKRPGHKDDATFDDMMGGRTYYCSK